MCNLIQLNTNCQRGKQRHYSVLVSAEESVLSVLLLSEGASAVAALACELLGAVPGTDTCGTEICGISSARTLCQKNSNQRVERKGGRRRSKSAKEKGEIVGRVGAHKFSLPNFFKRSCNRRSPSIADTLIRQRQAKDIGYEAFGTSSLVNLCRGSRLTVERHNPVDAR